MRKLLLIIAIAILLAGFGYMVVEGVEIGNISVLGFKQIIDEDENIKEKNTKLGKLINEDYQNAVSALEGAEKSLKTAKEEYESKILLSSDSETEYVATIEKYEIEFLWTRLGNHAKDNGVDMKIDLKSSSIGTGFYKMNFTAIGSYVGITDFIYAIENDSELGFKIDNFEMTQNTAQSSSGNTSNTTASNNTQVGEVKATFSCDEIAINIESIEQNTTSGSTEFETTNVNTTQNKTSSTTTNTTNKSSNTTTNNAKKQSAADVIDNY